MDWGLARPCVGGDASAASNLVSDLWHQQMAVSTQSSTREQEPSLAGDRRRGQRHAVVVDRALKSADRRRAREARLLVLRRQRRHLMARRHEGHVRHLCLRRLVTPSLATPALPAPKAGQPQLKQVRAEPPDRARGVSQPAGQPPPRKRLKLGRAPGVRVRVRVRVRVGAAAPTRTCAVDARSRRVFAASRENEGYGDNGC